MGEVQKEERWYQGTYLVRCGNTDSDLLSYNTASTHDSKAMSEIPYETGSCYIFDRAYNKFSQLFSINQIGAYFVVRAKKNVQYKVVKWKRQLPKNVLSDCFIEFTEYKATKEYPKQLRLVRFFDEEQGREFAFLTNAMHISSSLVTELYKNRWQIELFFKWLKQHLKIKKFWGTTENAVRIQILYLPACYYRQKQYETRKKYIRSLADFKYFAD